jgi:hypothetical protein
MLEVHGAMSSICRVTGITRALVHKGATLRTENRSKRRRLSSDYIPREKRCDYLGDRRWISEWFHNDCPIVELDKSRQTRLLGKLRHCYDGETPEPVHCERRLLLGTKREARNLFKESEVCVCYI